MKMGFSGIAGLLLRTRKAIDRQVLLRRGESILVGVSGGLDSMVLLHVLQKLAPMHGWHLSVAHLNHQLRGRSSDADERLVRRTCKELGLPIFVERADVRRLAKEEKISLEMAARQARHEFFRRVAAKKGISTIALAHHADDQVELFFIRLLRGSGGEGLAGMKWRSPLPERGRKALTVGVRESLCPRRALSIEIVRPLLGEWKAALREYAAENKIKFREDATNASLDILRNRIRHELLPLLRRGYQPALSEVILRSAEIVDKEAELAKRMAEEWLGYEQKVRASSKAPAGKLALRAGFSTLPVAMQRRCLQMQLLAEGVSPDFALIEHLRLKPEEGICVEQADGFARCLVRNLDGFVGWQGIEAIKFKDGSREVMLVGGLAGSSSRRNSVGRMTFNGVNLRWKVEPKAGKELPKRKARTEYFDAEKVGSKVILRHWRRGDRFQPIGMAHSVKLQDLFVNQKVPQMLRHRLVLAESEKGEIFWVEGQRISERFQLTKATKRRLQWQWMRD
jgi:tRNA(Ile)-lysidine synthase